MHQSTMQRPAMYHKPHRDDNDIDDKHHQRKDEEDLADGSEAIEAVRCCCKQKSDAAG